MGQYRKVDLHSGTTGIQHNAQLRHRPVYKQAIHIPSRMQEEASVEHATAWIYYSAKYKMWVVGPVVGGFNKLWLAVNSSAHSIQNVRSGWIVFENSVWHKVSFEYLQRV